MSFNATLDLAQGTATMRLTGDLDSHSAPELNELIAGLAPEQVQRLVLLINGLTYLSSAGLRCLVFAHQKMGPEVAIILVGTRPEVAETIRLTGFDRAIMMQNPSET
jgi:anti-anti-sigma factor